MDTQPNGIFKDRKQHLSLDLKDAPHDGPARSREPRNMSLPLLQSASQDMPTPEAQKQYAQGFFDALRSVHHINNFEFDTKKTPLLSPLPNILSHEMMSPTFTPAHLGDLQAIFKAMASTPTTNNSTSNLPAVSSNGFPSPFSLFPGSQLLPGASIANVMTPCTSSSSGCSSSNSNSSNSFVNCSSIDLEAIKDGKIGVGLQLPQQKEIKPEPPMSCISEDSTDNMSERSRSSSVALSSGNMMSMDDQEQKKLDRKRARNRAAASKCRQKKMDRIQELELQVSQEKQQAHELEMELARLRSTLSQLQQLLRQPQTVSQM